jgi:hypothetical protein
MKFSNLTKLGGVAVASFSKVMGILNENIVKINGRNCWKIYDAFTQQKNPISTGTTGLVSMWKMDDGSGTNVDDAVGSNDGTITGASWVGSGHFGYAGDNSLSLTGTNQISLGDFPACEGQTTMTMMGWAKKTTIGSAGTLFRKISTSTSSYGAYIVNVSGYKIAVEIRNGSANYALWDFAGVLQSGCWFHWAFWLPLCVSNLDNVVFQFNLLNELLVVV